jgi:hypothetical protein
MELLRRLKECCGDYRGTGLNHEQQKFDATFTLEPLIGGKGFAIRFKATSEKGVVYHEEHSVIAQTIDGTLGLWNLNSNVPALLAHSFRRAEKSNEGGQHWVFGIGTPNDRESFREEITLELFPDGDVGYRYAWGMPGGDFGPRSGVRMTLCQ